MICLFIKTRDDSGCNLFEYLRLLFIISPVFIPSPFSFLTLPLLSRHFSFSHPLYSPGTFTFFNEITLLLARDFILDIDTNIFV